MMLFKKPANHFVSDKKDETFTVVPEDIPTPKALYFKGLTNCAVTVTASCTKLQIEACEGTLFILRGRIVTQIVEVWRSSKLKMRVEAVARTVQADDVKGLDLTYSHKALFETVVWTHCEDLSIQLDGSERNAFHTGLSQAKLQTHKDITEIVDSDQFIVRFVDGALANEVVVRIGGGFATTVRDDDAFIEKQKRDQEKLANVNKQKRDQEKLANVSKD
ncbi:hypothetical protein BJ741DRAFT_666646 [Chytriomyces cf. hyalinus JEL632]|nr:hypothetical protein BJ741DRAFT_666646 [Chytriomyces cf. hyalinus JEL632]